MGDGGRVCMCNSRYCSHVHLLVRVRHSFNHIHVMVYLPSTRISCNSYEQSFPTLNFPPKPPVTAAAAVAAADAISLPALFTLAKNSLPQACPFSRYDSIPFFHSCSAAQAHAVNVSFSPRARLISTLLSFSLLYFLAVSTLPFSTIDTATSQAFSTFLPLLRGNMRP